MIEIIPAIMPKNMQDLEDKLGLVAGHVSSVQLDIMDGIFVPEETWPYLADRRSFEALLKEEQGLPFWDNVDYEIDLMVANPETILNDWITAGAARIIVHVESTQNLPEIIKQFNEWFTYIYDLQGKKEKRDVELGLALNIDTPMEAVLPYLEDIDFVQFMGIDKIGYQGQAFDEKVLDKIRGFHNNHPEITLSVDGGVTHDNARDLIDAGVKRLVSGSAIFASVNVIEALDRFKNA
jgi:ribulose-phosphate 3-epimerase